MNSRWPGLVWIAAVALVAAGPAACSSSPPPSTPRHDETPASDPSAVAARISGDWQIAVERGGNSIEGWLHFGMTAGELVGSMTGPDNNSREISRITLKGDRISWQVAGDSRTEHYEGTLKDSSMEGTLKLARPGGGRRGGGGEEGSGQGGGRGGYGGYGGGYGGHHGGGHGGGGGGGGSSEIRWRAFRSVQATPGPAPEPTRPPAAG